MEVSVFISARVGTRCCGIPSAIGETGYYVPYGDAKTTAETIRKALNCFYERRKASRARIEKLFSLHKRESELVRHVLNLLKLQNR